MFKDNTVIVIGAGASHEVGLPTGEGLKQRIAQLLDFSFQPGREPRGDRTVLAALQTTPGRADINDYVRVARSVADAMPLAISIDNFIDTHKEDKRIEVCGKLAIVRSVLEAERSSQLYVDPSSSKSRLNHAALAKTWFVPFLQILTEGCRIDQLPERLGSLTLVVFNYDRCIEQFLYHSLPIYCRIDPKRAAELVASLDIYHPYGTVGHLPWQQGGGAIGFGDEPSATKLHELASQIKTFAEGTDPNASDILRIRQKIQGASTFIFLGFAFHPMNVELLKALDRPPSVGPPAVFGTAFNFSASDCYAISKDLKKLGSTALPIADLRNDLECRQLFHEYRRSLSVS